MSEQLVTDVGDINIDRAAEVKLIYNAIKVIPGFDGEDCNFDNNVCSGNRIYRSNTRQAPTLVVQPNDLTYNLFDIWIDTPTGRTWILLSDDYTSDPVCSADEGYDTNLSSCVTLLENTDDDFLRRRVWKEFTYSYNGNANASVDAGEI